MDSAWSSDDRRAARLDILGGCTGSRKDQGHDDGVAARCQTMRTKETKDTGGGHGARGKTRRGGGAGGNTAGRTGTGHGGRGEYRGGARARGMGARGNTAGEHGARGEATATGPHSALQGATHTAQHTASQRSHTAGPSQQLSWPRKESRKVEAENAIVGSWTQTAEAQSRKLADLIKIYI